MTQSPDVKFGVVSSVFIDSDRNDIFVNVITNPNREAREIKFSSPQPGFWMVPEQGDTVEVHKIDGNFVARYPLQSPSDFDIPTDLSAGDLCIKLNQDTELRFAIQGDGTVDVDLSADGEMTVSAPTVKLGGDTGTTVVARKGDTVEVESDLEGTLTGEITSGASNTEAK